jgi:hypothetical protein
MKGNNAFINEFDLSPQWIQQLSENTKKGIPDYIPYGSLCLTIRHLLSQPEVESLNAELDTKEWIPVGIDGIKSNYKPGDDIGSWRLSCYEENLAAALWERIKGHIQGVQVFNEFATTDWDEHPRWEPIGINPLFRFIKYTNNGVLVPHYDAPFIEDADTRSLSSVVIYLSDIFYSGATRFIADTQSQVPFAERNHQDWAEEATDEQSLLKITPLSGDTLIFDHYLLHDSERLQGDQIKTIIRTDIMYRKV